jgi:hypothetical protein
MSEKRESKSVGDESDQLMPFKVTKDPRYVTPRTIMETLKQTRDLENNTRLAYGALRTNNWGLHQTEPLKGTTMPNATKSTITKAILEHAELRSIAALPNRREFTVVRVNLRQPHPKTTSKMFAWNVLCEDEATVIPERLSVDNDNENWTHSLSTDKNVINGKFAIGTTRPDRKILATRKKRLK